MQNRKKKEGVAAEGKREGAPMEAQLSSSRKKP